MDLILEQGLIHQQKAVDALRKVFENVRITAPARYENPAIDLYDSFLQTNIERVQKDMEILPENRRALFDTDCLNLDIKMETGTGKTYVYTNAIYELNKYYGFNKFIVAVPSLAIKSGTAQFMKEPYVLRHFKDVCGYGTNLKADAVEAHARKAKRSYFPMAVRDFMRVTSDICVLIINMQMLTANEKYLLGKSYDYSAEGFFRPLDALKASRPILIIDEPHRFDKNNNAYKVIKSEINPQCIIRFGATFPETSTGKGKNKIQIKDYQNLLYDLNACQSFNQGLIKGVATEHFEPLSHREDKLKIVSAKAKSEANFQYKQRGGATKTYTLKSGDSLSMIDPAFEGVTVSAIKKSSVLFSNGIEKNTGEELDVDIYMTSYQEQMLRLALRSHFATEKANFCDRNTNKIKTLALFFIDDITSYRTDEEGKTPYLREAFERQLKTECTAVLNGLDLQNKAEAQYAEFLRATLEDLPACHAGYFAKDNSDSDEDISREIELILHGKKELLAFKKEDVSWNTCRFLFSKWTLKEGWDNPNVFTIAKLRSSGSEISKLQEVGRGLRLPVDEHGRRVSNGEFYLNYIIDFTEADFADRLVAQINSEIPQAVKISEQKLREVAHKLKIDTDELFEQLCFVKRYIDRHNNILTAKREAFFEEYPDFASGLAIGKVKDVTGKKKDAIGIRKNVYDGLQQLWESINTRYLLLYDKELDDNFIEDVALLVFEKGVFKDVVLQAHRNVVREEDGKMRVGQYNEVQYVISRPVNYGTFLKRIAATTNIPVTVLHRAMCRFVKEHGEVPKDKINEQSATAFYRHFTDWKNKNLQGRFRYVKNGTIPHGTFLTNADGSPKSHIYNIGRIGIKIDEATPCDKYLYDTCAYDSALERENILAEIESVVVYGKIPRTSIAIPVVTGESYTPDFMYVVKRKDGTKELNVIVETKDVETDAELRATEEMRLSCAEVFFNNLTAEGYKVYFKRQLNNNQMLQVLNEVFSEEARA